MKNLIKKIEQVKKSQHKNIINSRVREFEKILEEKNKDRIFSELCFCLMTANWQAQKAIQLQEELYQDFFKTNEKELAQKLKSGGHRFWPQRAFNIVQARQHKDKIHEMIINKTEQKEIREWIAENIRGLGMKESSHFLRNIGYKNCAIIDFHIIDLLANEGLIEKKYEKETIKNTKSSDLMNARSTRKKNKQASDSELDKSLQKVILTSKSLTKKKYLEIESILDKLSKKTGISQGELDLYLWFIETGKILK